MSEPIDPSPDPLTEAQRRSTERALAEECARRDHLVIALCGAHAYGFASEDSDVDLKAVHVEPTERFLGLATTGKSWDRLEVLDGVEIDYTSNELAAALSGVLSGNGNMLERLLDPAPLVADPALEGLRPIVRRNLSRRIHRHYRGFAHSQRKAFEQKPTIKKALYVLRTALTGTHALTTGAVTPHLPSICDRYGFPEAHGLILQKRAAEQTAPDAGTIEDLVALMDRAFETLDAALATSPLPEAPEARDALDAWLVALRLERLESGEA